MSKNKRSLAELPSAQLLQQYNEVCFKLGQEIGNERRAYENQEKLKEAQASLEEAFNTAKAREDEQQAAKARDEAAKKAREEKRAAESVPQTAPKEAKQAS